MYLGNHSVSFPTIFVFSSTSYSITVQPEKRCKKWGIFFLIDVYKLTVCFNFDNRKIYKAVHHSIFALHLIEKSEFSSIVFYETVWL